MQKIFKLFQVLAVMIFAGTAANAEIVKMTPDVAREKALAGELVLIDIRRPEEWAETGVPDVALLLDMTSREFLSKLNAIRLQNPDVPETATHFQQMRHCQQPHRLKLPQGSRPDTLLF